MLTNPINYLSTNTTEGCAPPPPHIYAHNLQVFFYFWAYNSYHTVKSNYVDKTISNQANYKERILGYFKQILAFLQNFWACNLNPIACFMFFY